MVGKDIPSVNVICALLATRYNDVISNVAVSCIGDPASCIRHTHAYDPRPSRNSINTTMAKTINCFDLRDALGIS